MMDTPEQPDRDEQNIARLLRAVGPRQELPPQLQAQWEQTFRAELQPVLERRTRRRNGVAMGLCASVALMAVALWFNTPESATPRVSIVVSHVSGDHQLRAATGDTQYLRVNQQLPTGSAISTGADGFVTVTYNGYDLRMNHNTHITFAGDRIQMLGGDLYASDEMNTRQASSLLINTPHGTIRDIGTQFTVRLLPHETVATVRRGALLVSTGSVELRAAAYPDSAVQVTLDEGHAVSETRVEPSGAAWDWIYQGAPAYDLEGKSTYDFLRWSVAESGLHLEFASDAARIYASTTLLSGDFGQLNPEQAIDPVLATTDLEAQRSGNNTLLVSLKTRD